mgnify:CR=1 FL=1
MGGKICKNKINKINKINKVNTNEKIDYNNIDEIYIINTYHQLNKYTYRTYNRVDLHFKKHKGNVKYIKNPKTIKYLEINDKETDGIHLLVNLEKIIIYTKSYDMCLNKNVHRKINKLKKIIPNLEVKIINIMRRIMSGMAGGGFIN